MLYWYTVSIKRQHCYDEHCPTVIGNVIYIFGNPNGLVILFVIVLRFRQSLKLFPTVILP